MWASREPGVREMITDSLLPTRERPWYFVRCGEMRRKEVAKAGGTPVLY
ncbi:MAG TPA: hypothetical protein PK024_11220 [Methanospirillum sp.]|nr:hypothetical protein [Methanospirillum sp.]HOJ97391.1 hypothetical protein [Methanospirillum sp.]